MNDAPCEVCGGPAIPVRSHTESVIVDATPDALYAMLSDVTRTGEWSATCRACWWDEGQSAAVGSFFTGRNETPVRTWETRSQVVSAEPGREFAWEVNGGFVRWGYSMEPVESGTRLTEFWDFRPMGIRGFHDRYGDDAHVQIQSRVDQALTGIPITLQAIKKVAETSPSSPTRG